MIKPFCDICGQDLEDFGGLIFSPPMGNAVVIKQHICQGCYHQQIVPLLKASNLYTKDIWVTLDKANDKPSIQQFLT